MGGSRSAPVKKVSTSCSVTGSEFSIAIKRITLQNDMITQPQVLYKLVGAQNTNNASNLNVIWRSRRIPMLYDTMNTAELIQCTYIIIHKVNFCCCTVC